MNNSDITVALLIGGASSEREVSKSSSKAVFEALKSLGYNIKLTDPSYGENQPEDSNLYFGENDFAEVSSENYPIALNKDFLNDVDVVFIGLHGKWGEDGMVQSILALNEIKYTGSGLLASALGMDKNMSKIMFKHHNVKTAPWFMVTKTDIDVSSIKDKIGKSFGYPCIIKPNDAGSTIGLTVCKSDDEVEKCLNDAFEQSDSVMVEKFIKGNELTVGILGDQTLPPLEIKPKHGLYDYECKYTDGMSEYIVPAEFPENVLKHLQQQALLAYKSIGCSNYARIDFLLDENYDLYCLEVNTLPGMTSHSLVPKMAKAVGISFNELIDRIVKTALQC